MNPKPLIPAFSPSGGEGRDEEVVQGFKARTFSFRSNSSPPPSTARRRNTGGYDSPFSGVGLEFFPLGLTPGTSGVVIHEVGHQGKNDQWNFPGMFSPYWRLIYDWQPGHRLAFPGREVFLGHRRLFLIPDHIRCDFRGDAPVPTSWIHFTFELHPAREQAIPIVVSPGELELGLLKELAGLFNQPPNKNRQRVFALALALLQVVLSRPELHWLEETPDGVRRAMRFIQEHYAEPIYHATLARNSGLSIRSLTRSFKQFRGIAPSRFIAQVRVRHASHLLASTPLRLDEIASRTGFPNAAYLSRMFKRLTGMTPAQFRKEQQAPQIS